MLLPVQTDIQQLEEQTFNKSDKCLHIGCGLVTPEEWINLDASPSLKISQIPVLGSLIKIFHHSPNWSKSVWYGDIIHGLNYPENSCKLVFTAHVLEHLSYSDFQVALTNIYNYLEPGGIFRLIVPDLKYYIDTYIQHYHDPSLAPYAAREFQQESLIGCSSSRKNFWLRMREALSNSRHQWMWDQPSLIYALTQQGFSQVRQCEYGDWSDSRFGLVEKEENYLHAIGIEAVK